VLRETISITTIDILLKQFDSDRLLSLIKADIEGYEYEMLCGAEQSIEKHNPCLLMEASVNRNEILEFLWQRSYTVFALKNYSGKSREQLELVQIDNNEENQTRNILAIHESKRNFLGAIQTQFC
jgi:hypothetical protein